MSNSKPIWRKKILNGSGIGTDRLDGIEIEVSFAECERYLICVVKYLGSVGLSFCSPVDRRKSEFTTDRSIKLAFDRRFLKDEYEGSVPSEYYTFLAMKTLIFNVPHIIERSLRREHKRRTEDNTESVMRDIANVNSVVEAQK